MSRFTDDFAEILLAIPWWANVVLAGGSYVVLKAVFPTLQSDNPFSRALFSIGPTLAPYAAGVFLFFSFVSWIKSVRVKLLFRTNQSIQSIRNLSWQDFEEFIGETYRRDGYAVTKTPSGPDGGVDVIAQKDGKTYFIQCKHWKSQSVGAPEVQQSAGIVAAKGVAGGVLVTTGRFTTAAREFAKQSTIELVDGTDLATRFGLASRLRNVPISSTAIKCPKCGSELIQKTATRGKYKGQPFLSCSRFPACNGLVNES